VVVSVAISIAWPCAPVWKICANSPRKRTDCRNLKQLNSFSRNKVDGVPRLRFNAPRCPDSFLGAESQLIPPQ
jgi:hypothetical protein